MKSQYSQSDRVDNPAMSNQWWLVNAAASGALMQITWMIPLYGSDCRILATTVLGLN